jgi:hypothetical protein
MALIALAGGIISGTASASRPDAQPDVQTLASTGRIRPVVAALAGTPAVVGVTNGSFEATPLPVGGTSFGSPPGWSGGLGLYHPDATSYSAISATRPQLGTMSGPDVLSLFEMPGQSVAQTTQTMIEPGVRYTLTVAIGERDDADVFGGAVLSLLAGGAPVATRTVAVAPVQGSFGDVQLSWTGTAEQAGRALGIRLGQAGGGRGSYLDVDNVRLSEDGTALGPTELVLAEPSSRQVIQRSGAGTGTVPVRGVAPAGASLQARLVVRAGARGAATGWAPIAVDRAGGAFRAALTDVQAGWYDLRLRLLSSSGSVTMEQTVDRVGIGEVFVTAGQSNSANHGSRIERPSGDQVSSPLLGFGGWQSAADPQPNATGTGGSPWPAFGDDLTAATGVPVGIVAVGYGGTTIAQWQPGGTLYSRLQQAIAALGPHGLRAVLWHQGESDARDCTSTNSYRSALSALIAASRQDAGFPVPWGISTASTVPASTAACRQAVTDGQAAVRHEVVATFAGPDTDAYCAAGWCWDATHFSEAGLRRHGAAWALAVQQWGGLPA